MTLTYENETLITQPPPAGTTCDCEAMGLDMHWHQEYVSIRCTECSRKIGVDIVTYGPADHAAAARELAQSAGWTGYTGIYGVVIRRCRVCQNPA